jgi:Short C-terminal domain/Protein of unknown function (DUF3592)
MLGLGNKKLYKEGALTEGLVVHRSDTTEGINYHVTIRVKFPDGTTTEFKKWLDWHDVGQLHVGSVVPVRYDPSDHSKVVLDVPALEECHAKADAAGKAQLDAQFARLGEPSSVRTAAENPGWVVNLSSGSSRQSASDPVDRLAKLADLKERGVLSDEEFAAEKAKILGES